MKKDSLYSRLIEERAGETIAKYRMLNKGDKVVIGVSGGPDSVCLVYVLRQLSNLWRLNLNIAHLNHGLRGKDSEEDLDFTRRLASRIGLPFWFEEIDVKAEIKKRGFSEEEGARILRYEFFLRVSRKIGAKKIALGHSKDDQSETVLMRLVKGAGPLGLCGIPPLREWQGVAIVRPLFDVWRKEILEYLKEKNIDYRLDSTNVSSIYLRNRIRNELIPYLAREFNPNIKEILANTAENLGVVYEYLHKQGLKKFHSAALKSDTKVVLNLEKIKGYSSAIQREIFRNAVKELKGDLRRIRYQHWKEFESLIEIRPTGSVVDLPGDISVEKRRKEIIFKPKKLD